MIRIENVYVLKEGKSLVFEAFEREGSFNLLSDEDGLAYEILSLHFDEWEKGNVVVGECVLSSKSDFSKLLRLDLDIQGFANFSFLLLPTKGGKGSLEKIREALRLKKEDSSLSVELRFKNTVKALKKLPLLYLFLDLNDEMNKQNAEAIKGILSKEGILSFLYEVKPRDERKEIKPKSDFPEGLSLSFKEFLSQERWYLLFSFVFPFLSLVSVYTVIGFLRNETVGFGIFFLILGILTLLAALDVFGTIGKAAFLGPKRLKKVYAILSSLVPLLLAALISLGLIADLSYSGILYPHAYLEPYSLFGFALTLLIEGASTFFLLPLGKLLERIHL